MVVDQSMMWASHSIAERPPNLRGHENDRRIIAVRNQFLRLKARRGPKKVAIAVAASILTAVYHMLRDGIFFRDLGPDHKTRAAMRLVRRIKDLGYDVEIKAAA